jgi:hypothetical protein
LKNPETGRTCDKIIKGTSKVKKKEVSTNLKTRKIEKVTRSTALIETLKMTKNEGIHKNKMKIGSFLVLYYFASIQEEKKKIKSY